MQYTLPRLGLRSALRTRLVSAGWNREVEAHARSLAPVELRPWSTMLYCGRCDVCGREVDCVVHDTICGRMCIVHCSAWVCWCVAIRSLYTYAGRKGCCPVRLTSVGAGMRIRRHALIMDENIRASVYVQNVPTQVVMGSDTVRIAETCVPFIVTCTPVFDRLLRVWCRVSLITAGTRINVHISSHIAWV